MVQNSQKQVFYVFIIWVQRSGFMIKLRFGYIFLIILMGLVFVWQYVTSIPDGKLHITICDVGQGDSAYLRFPDGRDMVIDGGPGSQVLTCLGKIMPFWDRRIDSVVLTHPDQDHFKGLIDVLRRYQVGVFVRSDIDNPSPLYKEVERLLSDKKIPVRSVTAGERINIGAVTITILWPAQAFLSQTNDVLVTSSTTNLSAQSHRNDYAIVFHIRYGKFDGIFTGDADERVESYFTGEFLSPDGIEFLKVPHHGSRTGMTQDFLSWLHPLYATISVGAKNTYGHPSSQTIQDLMQIGSKIYRTDQNGSIYLVTDGKTMSISSDR